MYTWEASQTSQPACVRSLSVVSLATFSDTGANATPLFYILMLQGFHKNSNYHADTSWKTYGARAGLEPAELFRRTILPDLRALAALWPFRSEFHCGASSSLFSLAAFKSLTLIPRKPLSQGTAA